MAPIKFEEHIKEKFEAREIKPSENAWGKLSEALDNSSKDKNRGFLWYAIAASVVGLLIASLFFFIGQNDEVLNENKIVNQEKNTIKATDANDQLIIIEDSKIELVETSIKSVEKLEQPVVSVKKQEQINQNLDSNNELASTNNLEESQADKVKTASLIDDQELINAKIGELIAQVDSMELNNRTITDSEIDALLHKAQNEILKQRIFKDTNSVDAMALLSEAEDELNGSFRDQLFETLKNGYLKVRTAVADRNN